MKVKFARILPGTSIDFKCDDADLSEFFSKDWMDHEEQLFAVTYGLFFDEECVAMFSVANDRVDATEMGKTEEARTEALAEVPDTKRRYRHFPAVKIARLAVADEWRGKGIGAFIIAFLKSFFIIRNKTGCRYMTVDSYPTAVGFYSKYGSFQPFPNRTAGKHIAMYTDLLITKNMIDKTPKIREQYESQIKAFAPNNYAIEFEVSDEDSNSAENTTPNSAQGA